VVRLLAGFTSAVVFVGAVNWMVDHLRHQSPYLTGWGFGGVGVGIAVSGSLVLILPATAGWRSAWWLVAVFAAILSVGAVASSATQARVQPAAMPRPILEAPSAGLAAPAAGRDCSATAVPQDRAAEA